MASNEAKDLFKLLQELKSVTPNQVAEAENSRIQTLKPNRLLLEPRDPDFVWAYTPKLASRFLTMQMVYDAYCAGENIFFTGPSGNGKTSAAFALVDLANETTRKHNREVWARNQKRIAADPKIGADALEPYKELPYKVSYYECHKNMVSEELTVSLSMATDENGQQKIVRRIGACVDAWAKTEDSDGKTLIVDEIDMGNPGVWGQLHVFLDGQTETTSLWADGRMDLEKGPRFRFMATANTKGRGENAVEFAGTQPLNKAFLNRMNQFVELGWLPQDQEARMIVRKTSLRQDVARRMVDVATRTRTSHEQGLLEDCISTRELLAWARESVREAKRHGAADASKMDVDAYWRNVSQTSMFTTVLNKIEDENTVGKIAGLAGIS